MEHSTPGNPQMNSTSDPSIVDDQTVNLRDPVTMTDEHMCRKYWDVHSNDQEQNLNYCSLQENEYNLHSFKGS